jgi:hypothetical protein
LYIALSLPTQEKKRVFKLSEAVLELEYPQIQSREEYAHSLRSLRGLGRVSLEIIPLTSDVPEVKEAWTDFVSALEENIATDPELSEKLTFNPMRVHDVVDGYVVDNTGRSIVNLVADGLVVSKQQALFDKRMESQVERDEGDVLVAEAVDGLVVGEMLATISMDPKEALALDKDFWEDKAYREGMAVLQVYYRTSNGLMAGAYAIKDSNVDDLRELFAEHGLVIPESENCNRWTRHHLVSTTTEENAKSFGDEFVKSYRQKRGLNEQQLSTTDFLKENQIEVQSFFDAYIVPVATSTVTGINNESTKSLAASMHQSNADSISPQERSSLLKVANSDKFDDNDARFMESKIRYALIEHLRPKLIAELSVPTQVVNSINNAGLVDYKIRTIEVIGNNQIQRMNEQLSLGLGRGVQENRTYGGCSSAKTESNGPQFELGTQDIFGGKSNTENEDTSGESDENGPLKFKCTKGHLNKREKGGWVYECQKCGEDVSCGKKKP